MKFDRINPATGKPYVIGIPGYKYQEHSFGAGLNHLEFISKFGNARIIMPWEEFVAVDMLYLPGGLDTAPANYEEIPGFNTSNQDVFKEFFFKKRLPAYLEANVPIFGVCLGAQMLAVQFGAKLTQDLLFHEQSSDRWQPAHKVRQVKNAPTFEGTVWKQFDVNSHHHQALTMNNITKDIEPLFIATNNDESFSGDTEIVEAFRIVGRPIFATQYHPEELYDAFSNKVIGSLLANKQK